MTGTFLGGTCHKQFFAAGRQPPHAPEGGDAGALLRDAGRRLWPCPQRPVAEADKYNSGTGNWGDYTRPLNRTRPPPPVIREAERTSFGRDTWSPQNRLSAGWRPRACEPSTALRILAVRSRKQ